MNKNNKKKQNSGMNNKWWILSPIIALVGYHIIMIIYLKITNKWEGFGINYHELKSRFNPKEADWPGYIIIFFYVIFRVLFKPYNN